MRTLQKLLILLLFGIVVPLQGMAQKPSFWLEGTIHGYASDPSRGILKKYKPPVFEGTLEQALIRVYLDGTLIDDYITNDNGNYSLQLEFNRLYSIIITKEGYNTNALLLDTRAYPKAIQKGGYRFTGAEFVLNSFSSGLDKSLDRNIGRLHYNPSKNKFNLTLSEGPQHTAATDATIELLERAILRNNGRIEHYEPEVLTRRSAKRTTPSTTHELSQETTPPLQDTITLDSSALLTISRSLDLGPRLNKNAADTNELNSKQEAVRRAREQLALDKLLQQTKFDSLEIIKREAQIQEAEQEIKHARVLILTQQGKLKAQRNSLILLILLLMLLTCSLYLGYNYYKNKQQNALLLEQKNKQITDSISYAQRIQQSMLVGERTLKHYLPDSFVLSEPRDIVSGDFYFFHPHPTGYIIAAADCTGHGVPGAFMSLIGHRLLREIIAEKGVTDPARILDELDLQLKQALQGEKEGDILQDGMDISVCHIAPEHQTITFAAAMNPAYLIQHKDLKVLQADINSVGGKVLRNGRKRHFTNKAITYTKGNMLYLFSDGYMDQFGAELDQKFNTRRFKDMLLKIQTLPADEQKEKVCQTLYSWKGNIRQTDDILLLGIRLP
ncbi:MAG: SpoIIE family protein phosphatase [Bacteroidetes bacterium]|nr:SpoIIE family protein phosphatase [Bacteroidota bacterium]